MRCSKPALPTIWPPNHKRRFSQFCQPGTVLVRPLKLSQLLLARYVGEYASDGLYRKIRVRMESDGLVVHWGDARCPLEPATPEVFGGKTAALQELNAFHFSRDENGRVHQVK